jgi:two-component system CheB/CheR fusion protein
MFTPTRPNTRPSSKLPRRSAARRRAGNASFNVVPLHSLQFSLGLEPLFLNARDALVVGDLKSGRILCWNRAAEQLFGYSAMEALGQHIDMLWPPAVGRLHDERIAHYVRSGEPDVLTGRGPLGMPALTRAREEIRVELSLSPIEVPGSQPHLILLTFRDASGERRIEMRALEAAHAASARFEVETKLRRCEQLWRESTSDLAEPVVRARRAAARLARLATAPEETSPHRLALLAQVVEGRADDIQRSFEQVADIAAIETGKFELDYERVNLVPLISRVVTAARARTSTHQLNYAAPQGLTAQCDPRRIEALVTDLIERAIRRNPRGCWIDVDLRRPLAGVARIEVRDYGRPISPRERERLSHSSSGDRGWFVNRYIVDQHGGTLETEFPREGGLRVIVSLTTHRARLLK